MIREFVLITCMGKQRSLILIIHHFSLNAIGDRNDAIMGYFTILDSRHFWPRAHVMDHVPCGFILQSDWVLKILRGNGRQKCTEALPGPFPDFLAGDEASWMAHFSAFLYKRV